MADTSNLTELAVSGRYKPKRRTATERPPSPDLTGSVDFQLIPGATSRTLTMQMVYAGGDDLRGYNTLTGEHYLRVPENKVVQLTLSLGGLWDWKFTPEGFTLGNRDHRDRYWLDSASDKSVTLIIEPSGLSAQAAEQHDEKFNLTVEIAQEGTKIPLVIMIDPITKNPPPVGGMIVPQDVPAPIY